MKRWIRLTVRWLVILALIVLAAGFAAPYVDAGAFRSRVQVALESALGRRVQMGDVHYSLFNGPGFQVDNVLIEDEPQTGIEPFAAVSSLQASIRLRSLFGGRLAFSTLRLDEPTVNLVRPGGDAWNIQPFLARMIAGHGASSENFPDIQVRSGRLNFKFGDTKSVFYISDADLDVYPRSSGELIVRFAGTPARTDRSPHGVGVVSCRGRVRVGGGGEDQIAVTLDMGRTPIPELGHLFGKPDSGIHGAVTAQAHIRGPVTHPSITGDLTIEDVHRWDLSAPASGEAWTVAWAGALDLRSQRIELWTQPPVGQPAAVAVKATVSDYLSTPNWDVSVALNELPASSLLGTARNMGLPLPDSVTVEGTVSGSVADSRDHGLSGQFALSDASITISGVGAARMEHADVTVALENGQSADISANWDAAAPSVRVDVGTRGVSIAQLHAAASALLGNGSVPLLDAATGGVLRGSLRYEQNGDDPGAWTGQYAVQNTVFSVDGLAVPLQVASASIATGPDELSVTKLRGRVGKIGFDADYRSAARPAAPARLRLAIGNASLDEVERVLTPTLRRQETLLTRLRLRRAAAPAWLRERNIAGTVEVKSLAFGETDLGSLNGQLRWTGTAVSLHDLDWTLDDASGSGELTVTLSGAAPRYHLTGRLDEISWREGGLSVEGTLDTGGAGADLLANARMEGTFAAHDATVAPDATFDEISGSFHFLASAAPRLTLEKLEARRKRDTMTGLGFSQPDGRIALDLASGHKQIRYVAAGLALTPAAAVEPR